MAQLRSYWEDARQVGQLGKIKRAQTKSGIKCKFQTHFLNTLAKSYSTKRKENTRQAALDAKLRELALVPRQTINPVWRIKGECFDPLGVRIVLTSWQGSTLTQILQWKSSTSFFSVTSSTSGKMPLRR